MKKSIISIISLVVLASCASAKSDKQDTIKTAPCINKDSAKVWNSIALDYMRKGDMKKDTVYYRSALNNFYRALYYDSQNDTFYISIARAYLGLSKIDSAEWAYRKVIQMNPKNSQGWQGLGFLFGIVKRETDSGIAYYQKAIAADTSNVGAIFGLAKLYEKSGRTAYCDTLYQKALQKSKNNTAILNAAGLFYKDKDQKKSADYFEKALKIGVPDKMEKSIREALLDDYVKLASSEKNKKFQKKYYRRLIQHADTLIAKFDTANYTYYLRRGTGYEGIAKHKLAILDFEKAFMLSGKKYALPLVEEAYVYIYSLKNYQKGKETARRILDIEGIQDIYKYTAYSTIGDADVGLAYTTYQQGKRLFLNGERKKGYSLACQSSTIYKQAVDEYTKAAQFAPPTAKKSLQDRITRTKAGQKKAFRVCKRIDVFK